MYHISFYQKIKKNSRDKSNYNKTDHFKMNFRCTNTRYIVVEILTKVLQQITEPEWIVTLSFSCTSEK